MSESHADGVSVPMVAKKYGVPDSGIYAWRGDVRFQPTVSEEDVTFTPVEVGNSHTDVAPTAPDARSSCAERRDRNSRLLR